MPKSEAEVQATKHGELAAWITGFGTSDGFDVRGAIKINGNTIFNYENGKYGISQNCWCTLKDTDYSYSGIFTSPSDLLTISFSSFRRNIGSGSSKDWSPAEGVHRKGLSKSIELLSTKMIYLDSP